MPQAGVAALCTFLMYVPQAFAQSDRGVLFGHAAEYPFATVVTSAGAYDIRVSHLPLLVDAQNARLRGHIARNNPQYEHYLAGVSIVAIFHGPHGYVSPSVYTEPGVPTWNYVVVHAEGKVKVLDEWGLRGILDDTVRRFDRTGWRIDDIGDALQGKLDAIAGFEIDVARIEGKFKLSQNRSALDRSRVVEWLEKGDELSRRAAAMMRNLQ
jgi:transcriptional regulator